MVARLQIERFEFKKSPLSNIIKIFPVTRVPRYLLCIKWRYFQWNDAG